MRTRIGVCAFTALFVSGVVAATSHQDESTVRVRSAVTKSIALLQTSGHAWVEEAGCASCHHQSLPALTFALARARGFTVDDRMSRERIQAFLGRWKAEREALFQADTGALARGPHGAAYTLIGLAADEVPPNTTTDAIAHYLVAQQRPDGRFHGQNLMRPPLEDSDVTATALSIRALQAYAPPGRHTEVAGIVRRARNWLLSINPRGTEEATFQLQGLSWAKADQREITARVATLQKEQRPDGGWAQLPGLQSDAYATGQTLVAMHQAGGLPTASTVYRAGITFLLNTQADDGSWFVRSRARGTQPYVNSGFPYGTNQFISAAGTAWATSALVLSLDATVPRAQ
jgi:hypothetical protein